MKIPRIHILCIGTELTQGQIVNRNASYIANHLSKLGFTTWGHTTVPDDRPLIQDALSFLWPKTDWLFVTGGLGPTSDDFTREMMAQFAQKPLNWNDEAWAYIKERLAARGIEPRENQKQQCYFPEGAEILKNSQGTAHGFRIEHENKFIFVLPGPPKELKAIWIDHIDPWIYIHHRNPDPLITRSWETIGEPESYIAELSESALKGCPFEIGYRVHLPFVEVKLSYTETQKKQAEIYVDKLTTALSKYTVGRDFENPLETLAHKMKRFNSIALIDACTGDYLLNRWLPLLGPLLKNGQFQFCNLKPESPEIEADLIFEIEQPYTNYTCAKIKIQGHSWMEEITSPYNSLLQDRSLLYFAEKAILFWNQRLPDTERTG